MAACRRRTSAPPTPSAGRRCPPAGSRTGAGARRGPGVPHATDSRWGVLAPRDDVTCSPVARLPQALRGACDEAAFALCERTCERGRHAAAAGPAGDPRGRAVGQQRSLWGRRGRRVSRSLITQRSQVQILPPLQVKSQVRGLFSLRGGRASGVAVNGWSTWLAAGWRRIGADVGVRSSEWNVVSGDGPVASRAAPRFDRDVVGLVQPAARPLYA